MQDESGQIIGTHSVSAGLDYPGVGAEHSYLKDIGRVEYVAVNDDEVLNALQWVARSEGLIPALESSHAFATLKNRELLPKGTRVLVNMSGRGDKDMETAARLLNL